MVLKTYMLNGRSKEICLILVEFPWNLHENGKYPVDFMYKALPKPEVPVDNKNKLEDENTTKNQKKKIVWYLCQGVILTKDNLAK
jgi:hypothetical protein